MTDCASRYPGQGCGDNGLACANGICTSLDSTLFLPHDKYRITLIIASPSVQNNVRPLELQ